jgi:hypothetical protein
MRRTPHRRPKRTQKMTSAVTTLDSQCTEVKIRAEVCLHSVKNTLKHTVSQLSTERKHGDLRSFGSFCSRVGDFINHCRCHFVSFHATSRKLGAQRCFVYMSLAMNSTR